VILSKIEAFRVPYVENRGLKLRMALPLFSSLQLGQNDNVKSKLIVFLAGFPDNESTAWGSVLDGMAADSDYRIYALAIPGLGSDGAKGLRPWGWSFDELVSGLKATIDGLRAADGRQGQKFTLIGHDWGAHISLLYENKYGREDLERLALFDVGLTSVHPLSPRKVLHLAIIFTYQWWFALSFLVSQLPLCHGLGQLLFFAFVPLMRFIGPCPHDVPRRRREEITVDLCFLYFQFWKAIFLAKDKKSVTPRFPVAPLLFIYGNKKNVLFHSQKFLERIDRSGLGRWLAVQDAGHWIMQSHPALCISELRAFLKV